MNRRTQSTQRRHPAGTPHDAVNIGKHYAGWCIPRSLTQHPSRSSRASVQNSFSPNLDQDAIDSSREGLEEQFDGAYGGKDLDQLFEKFSGNAAGKPDSRPGAKRNERQEHGIEHQGGGGDQS